MGRRGTQKQKIRNRSFGTKTEVTDSKLIISFILKHFYMKICLKYDKEIGRR